MSNPESYQILRQAIDNLAKANLEVGISLGAVFNNNASRDILDSLTKVGIVQPPIILPASISNLLPGAQAGKEEAPGAEASKSRKRPEVESKPKESAPKRTKQKKQKKQKLYIKNRTGLPEIDLMEVESKWEELQVQLKENAPDGLILEYEGTGDQKKIIFNSKAITLALKILDKNLNFLTPATLAKWNEARKNKRHYRLCCIMALIVAIERKRIWSTVEYDPEDFVVTSEDIPPTMPTIGVNVDKKKPRKAKDEDELKIRTSRQTACDIYKMLAKQNADSAELLSHYEFKNVGRILCFKWNSSAPRSAKDAKDAEFKKPETCKVVSEKTKKFLDVLLMAEEWQREMECLYYLYQEDQNKPSTTAAGDLVAPNQE